MEDGRRETRIPRPPKLVKAPVKESEVLQESNKVAPSVSRKRKGPSPVKPPAKRPTPAATRSRAVPSKAAAQVPQTPAAGPSTEENWEHLSEQLGWSPEECLNHKLTFKKREDMKTTKDTLLQHIKRLRALGWHLLMLKDKYDMDSEAMKGALAQEEALHAEDKERLEAAVQELEKSKAVLQSTIEDLQGQVQEKDEQIKKLQTNLSEITSREASLAVQKLGLEAEQKRLQTQLADSIAQVEFQRTQHQSAQQYSTQLQSYNTKLQSDMQEASAELKTLNEERNTRSEEAASLRGTISALETQIEAARSAASGAESARQQSSADCSRLREDLSKVTAQRDEVQATASALQEELLRYRDATGKSVENLEKEKASKAILENQNKAQVEFNCELQDELASLRAQLAMSQTTNERQVNRAAEIEAKRRQLEEQLQIAEQKVREGELLRRKLHNTILELKGNIRVFCRVRPQTLENLTTESVDGKEMVQFATTGELAGQALEIAVNNISSNGQTSHKFSFDKVFGPATPQHEVFEEISQLVQSALDGYKVCIFAYGQTGSGKTYTMMGPPDTEHRGVIPRAVNQLFDACQDMKEQGWTFEMKASMVEIYNEEVKDLLGKGAPAGKKHQISHDDQGNTNVSFVEYVDCKRPEKVRDLLNKASRMRTVGATAANEQSSRSHMVFSMSISGSNESSGQQIRGMLNLIDLAGSERLSKSLATGDRLKETQAINKSLSALGDVIVALGAKDNHIPYRNSKLTYLLQPCLGGDAKTLMFVNIAPTLEASNESLCSLRFAAKVNATEIGTAKRNMGSK